MDRIIQRAYQNDEPDIINKPSHYTKGGIEPIDAMQGWLTDEQYEGMLLGNTIKYLSRCNHKDNKLQDLKKSLYYLERLIKELDK